MDDQHHRGDAESKAVPAQPAARSWPLAVAGRLVVFRRPEPLGIQAEHRQQHRKTDRDEHAQRIDELVHIAG